MMGRQTSDQAQLFYLLNLERRIPAGHLLRRINPVVTRILVELRAGLAPFYSDIGRPSIDPELMIRMLIVGYWRTADQRSACGPRPATRLSPLTITPWRGPASLASWRQCARPRRR
jgi:hypothetical protein